jgi:uncharacterized protein with LGFP repeats
MSMILPRPARAFVAIALAGVALTAGLATKASAEEDVWGAREVRQYRYFLPEPLKSDWFAEEPWGGPYNTPEVFGAYEFYQGPAGRGAVYWSERTFAHEMHGDILRTWEWNDYERGVGFPSTDEISAFSNWQPDARKQEFNKGTAHIVYSTYGTYAIYGDIHAAWMATGGEHGYGYPSYPEYKVENAWTSRCPVGHQSQIFQTVQRNWFACWDPDTRIVTWQ